MRFSCKSLTVNGNLPAVDWWSLPSYLIRYASGIGRELRSTLGCSYFLGKFQPQPFPYFVSFLAISQPLYNVYLNAGNDNHREAKLNSDEVVTN